MWADGGVAGNNGQLSLEATIHAGAMIPAVNGATVLRRTAEVPDAFDIDQITHIANVVVDHGPEQVSMRGVQTGTRGGGCAPGTERGGKAGPFGSYACGPVQDVEYPSTGGE